MTEHAKQALSILRDPGQFKWYIIPLIVIIVYIYSKEIENKKWNVVFAGLSFWGMDLFNEIWNSLVFHFTEYAPVWGAPGNTAYLPLIGLNIEISFGFLVAGIAFSHTLPEDKKEKILHIPNRLFYSILFSIIAVIVECILNAAGALTWDYPWWSIKVPYLIFLIGYMPFFVVSSWVHDMETTKKQAIATMSILLFDILCIIIFGPILHWI